MNQLHELLTIDQAPRRLHPVETILVSAALARGRHIRACACGWIIVANNDTDAYCMFQGPPARRAGGGPWLTS